MARYETGQSVRYKPTVGVITDVLTEPGIQADRNVQASPDSLRYKIQNYNTDKVTTVYEVNILGPSQ
ncbi:hypothetical protein F5883DRAFT_607669 [Diaporthe sp. PMI_573]|nr:hypothetical protein F5883DRAFT_607669 [Diaporthaceae sp. PMI_573]